MGMKTFIKNGKTLANIDELHLWDKNPRDITQDKYENLKWQIQKMGVLNPLKVESDGTILGGNMRMRAMTELGMKEIWVEPVNPKNDTERVEISLADNDRAGYYIPAKITEMLTGLEGLDMTKFSIDLNASLSLNDFANFYDTKLKSSEKIENVEGFDDQMNSNDYIIISFGDKAELDKVKDVFIMKSNQKSIEWEKVKEFFTI